MQPNLYIRALYKICIQNQYGINEYFDNEHLDTEYIINTEHHDHTFWYCVDFCWKNTNEFGLSILLFQMVVYTFKLEGLDKEIQEKILEYGRNHVHDWENQINDHIKSRNILPNEDLWWRDFG